ncbi:unnamed protein product [Calicophoron daubneyi]|uniref:Uncharacterized protein n=1 Tax=Calicophoron daubneyi TaxID=300641 RepID=A0AAV2TMY0_CALDB
MSFVRVNKVFARICGEEKPYWEFMNITLSWDTDQPDLSRCFQMTIMFWLSVFLLVIGISVRVLILVKQGPVIRYTLWKPRVLHISKQLFLGFLITSDIMYIKLVCSVVPEEVGDIYTLLTLTNSTINMFLWILMSMVIYYELLKGAGIYPFYFYYWFYLSVAAAINLRTSILHGTNGVFYRLEEAAASLRLAGALGLLMLNSFVGASSEELDIWKPSKEDQGLIDESRQKPICPQEKASYLSVLFYMWFTKLTITGLRRPVQFDDLWRLRSEFRSACIMSKVVRAWSKLLAEKSPSQHEQSTVRRILSTVLPKLRFRRVQKASSPSVVLALAASAWSLFITAGLYRLAFAFLGFTIPIFISKLIQFITIKNSGAVVYMWHGYLFAAGLSALAIVRTLFIQQALLMCFSVGMNVRAAVMGLVYRKALRLSVWARQSSTVGEIVNLMSVDAQMLAESSSQLHFIWETPLTVGVCFYLAWQQLGWAAAMGLIVALLLIPINTLIAKRVKTVQVKLMRFKDERIKLLDQTLAGIKVIKMFAWEPAFGERITELRNQEVRYIRSIAYLNAIIASTLLCAPLLIALVSFGTYVLTGTDHILDAQKAFVSLTLFNIMAFPLVTLPELVAGLAQGYVSIRRIRQFLLQPEIQQSCLPTTPLRPALKYDGAKKSGTDCDRLDAALYIHECTLGWDPEHILFKNISLSVPRGKLYIIVGAVGTGKSSLVLAVLNEMFRLRGEIRTRGSIAYVPQQAWCMNGTLQKNILFGRPMDKGRYWEVMRCCCLLPDLEQLPQKEFTEIGERGINLSGGQKQRISLARAVYQQADIYLLDDPLSAVDAHVANSLFEEVIGPRGLLKEKTRVLVTHRLVNLEEADQIVCMSRRLKYEPLAFEGARTDDAKDKFDEDMSINGQVSGECFMSEMGTYDELMKEHKTFFSYISSRAMEKKEEGNNNDEEGARESNANNLEIESDWEPPTGGEDSDQQTVPSFVRHRSSRRLVKVEKREEGLTEEEKTATGGITWSVVATYITAYGFRSAIFTAACYILYILCVTAVNLWLRYWSESGTSYLNRTDWADNKTGHITIDTSTRDYFLGLYTLLGVFQGIFALSILMSQAHGTAQASKHIHSRLLESILRAPTSFFDTTPAGRILNRFSRDIDSVDLRFAIYLRMVSISSANVTASVVLICTSLPWFLLPLIPLTLILIGIQRVYIRTARQLKRIDSVKRSPIFCHFQETLSGLISIRAYDRISQFIAKADYLVDEGQISCYAILACHRWMSVGIEVVGHLSTVVACVIALITSIGAAYAGLIVTYSTRVSISIMSLLRNSTNLETCFVDVERIKEYIEIPPEAPLHIRGVNLDQTNWPSKREIVFENYSTRYREGLQLTLKSLNLIVKPGEKIGVVGRTGAGKSTLTLALFRLIEAAGGRILIDGVDIGKIGLHDLRSKITIIPQDPVIFSGTLRFNLDPANERSDGELWAALEGAHMKEFIEAQPEKLNFICAEGGWNLSAGQRQLICLARALLRKTKILILDEATAAVDVKTDGLIQDTIRTTFSDHTILTIAHRLSTVVDYDRILVLQDGWIAECDTPNNLLADPTSLFHAMAKEANIISP